MVAADVESVAAGIEMMTLAHLSLLMYYQARSEKSASAAKLTSANQNRVPPQNFNPVTLDQSDARSNCQLALTENILEFLFIFQKKWTQENSGCVFILWPSFYSFR